MFPMIHFVGEVVPPLPTVAITQDMLKPIADAIVSNVGVILPIAIAVFGVLIGVKLIPKVIGHFVH